MEYMYKEKLDLVKSKFQVNFKEIPGFPGPKYFPGFFQVFQVFQSPDNHAFLNLFQANLMQKNQKRNNGSKY